MPLPTVEQLLAASSLTQFVDDNYDLETLYTKLAKRYHPDRHVNPEQKAFAAKVFSHINTIKQVKVKTNNNKIKTKRHEYTILSSRKTNDGNLLINEATYDDGHELATLYVNRLARSQSSDNFYNALKKLNTEVPEKYSAFFPKFIERFDNVSPKGRHTIIVTDRYEGFMPLSKVKERYPDGISGRNVAWIFRRMLVALGNAHDVGLSHGTTDVGSEVLLNAEQHGLILTDWRSSSELTNEERSDDISAMARYMAGMLGKNEPKALTIFFQGCMLDSVPKASELLAEFDDLLLRIYGKPKFSVLEM